MTSNSPVLKGLSRLYAKSQAGRLGTGSIDFQPELRAVLREAGCEDGDDRAQALVDLNDAERSGLVRLERHRRDADIILKVRMPLANEAALFEKVGEPSPTQRREVLASLFDSAAQAEIPATRRACWSSFCSKMRQTALSGDAMAPFERENIAANQELLSLLPKLLSWKGESLIRFASCVLCGSSKRLEQLSGLEKEGEFQGRLRGKLGRLLEEVTGGEIRTLDDLGIVANPRFVLLHGPLRLLLDGEWLDLGRLRGAFRVAQSDIDRAMQITTRAMRCLTIENETSFHELAKLQSGELLIHTSFPGSGTLALLRRLPPTMEFWHFGDSDDAGFEVLRVLRECVDHAVRPLHMHRGRRPFEQEALGRPTSRNWPFYI